MYLMVFYTFFSVKLSIISLTFYPEGFSDSSVLIFDRFSWDISDGLPILGLFSDLADYFYQIFQAICNPKLSTCEVH